MEKVSSGKESKPPGAKTQGKPAPKKTKKKKKAKKDKKGKKGQKVKEVEEAPTSIADAEKLVLQLMAGE